MQDFLQQYRQKLLIGGPLLVILIILMYYIFGGRYESTDDAYLKAANILINANVPGQVKSIKVHDNEVVKMGQVLFELDDRPYKIRVEEAEAQLAITKLNINSQKALYWTKVADVKAARSTLNFELKELARQKKLAASGISSQTLLNKTLNNYNNALQNFYAANHAKLSALASLDNNAEIDVNQHPLVKQAQADLDRAKLNLSYTIVHAPEDGIVTKVEQLQVGDYISVGAPVFSLISSRDIWIEANFKETQITHMRPGESATIKIDAYSGKKFVGKVASLTPGTGSTFSLLPPENATGNWVKIVQRVPVRIQITNWDDYPKDSFLVLSGLSATVTVDTKDSPKK